MRSTAKATAAGLAGVVAVGALGYGLGREAGDGSAMAGGGGGGSREAAPPCGEHEIVLGVDRLADELGVEAEALRDALGDFHRQERDGRRGDFAKALADALGKSTEEVEDAFEQVRDQHLDRFAKRLAAALDLDAGEVRAALERVKDRHRQDGGPGDFFEDVAGELGVSEEKLADALRETGPRGGFGPLGHHGLPLRGLAGALDVTPAELGDALREVWADADSRLDDDREALVEFLAERFDLSRERVDEALPDFPGPGPGFHGRGGPHGFGVPGGPPPPPGLDPP